MSAFHSATNTDIGSDSDEEAWDQVDVSTHAHPNLHAASAAAASTSTSTPDESISIVISRSRDGKTKDSKGKGKARGNVESLQDRMVRQETHKVHVVTLFASAAVRNRYISSPLLQARLLSKVPLHLQTAFQSITPRAYPNERDRSRLFDRALQDLVSWWYQEFEAVPPERAAPEIIRGPSSLAKFALRGRGSMEMGATLFTATCRALGIPARLVMSLQPVGWRRDTTKEVGKVGTDGEATDVSKAGSTTRGKKGSSIKAKPKAAGAKKATPAKGKGSQKTSSKPSSARSKGSKPGSRASTLTISSDDSDVEFEDAMATDGGASTDGSWKDLRGNLGYTVPKVNLRRNKPSPAQKLRAAAGRSPSPDSYEMDMVPTAWTEIYTKANRQWITVDPSRKKIRCRGIMEPPKSSAKGEKGNVLRYVVAFEEDGSVRDVTPRYAKNYNTVTVKSRVPSKKGTDWFADLLRPHRRKFQLNRDREEDEELWTRTANEPMPSSIGGFKNHPTYVLEQHLLRDEALLPSARKLGVFRGTETVYPRSAVVKLKSSENYWRVGRTIKEGEEPLKWVKSRVVTINNRRAQEARKQAGEEEEQQGLYMESQTEVWRPPPVINGKIPKNDFGNIDLFVDTMLPFGATHVPNKGSAKAAKALGIDYADAIIGFEFRQRRAVPTIQGIVIASENYDLIIEAVLNTEAVTEEKEFAKRQARVLQRWKTLIVGLRIRQRLKAQYGASAPGGDEESGVGLSNGENKLSKSDAKSPRVPNGKAASAKSSANGSSPNKEPATRKPILPMVVEASNGSSRPKRKRPAKKASTDTESDSEGYAPAKSTRPTPARRSLRSTTKAEPATDSTGSSPKKSTSGRTLRFTISTEQAVAAKEANQKKDLEVKAIDYGETNSSQDGEGSDGSLELLSDF